MVSSLSLSLSVCASLPALAPSWEWWFHPYLCFYLSAWLLVVLSALHAAGDKPLSGGRGVEEEERVTEGERREGGEEAHSHRGWDYLGGDYAGINRCEDINWSISWMTEWKKIIAVEMDQLRADDTENPAESQTSSWCYWFKMCECERAFVCVCVCLAVPKCVYLSDFSRLWIFQWHNQTLHNQCVPTLRLCPSAFTSLPSALRLHEIEAAGIKPGH